MAEVTGLWKNPLPLRLVVSDDSESFRTMPKEATALPLAPHPGAYGVQRQNHVHEGIDLYCPAGTAVCAVESGEVVAVIPFTGVQAGSDWWENTDAVLIEGQSGVVVYGEIAPSCAVGQRVAAGQHIAGMGSEGFSTGSHLHFEIHPSGNGAVDPVPWFANHGIHF